MRSPRAGAGGLAAPGNAPIRGPVPVPGVQPGAQAQVVASRVLIIGTGGELLIYSPTAAAGNLIFSAAAKPGTNLGNAFLAGAASYTQISGSSYRAIVMQTGGLAFYSASSYAGPWSSTGGITIDGSGNMQLTAPGNLFFNGTMITVP